MQPDIEDLPDIEKLEKVINNHVYSTLRRREEKSRKKQRERDSGNTHRQKHTLKKQKNA